jgi:BetI-type transcriptional repressor, C-terminal
VLDKVAGDIENVLASDMGSASNALRKLEILIDTTFDVVRSTREYYQVNMDFWTQINQKREVREVIARHYAKFRDTATRVIKEGVDTNVFRKVNPSDYASICIAIIDGISLQWLFDEKVFDFDTIVKEASEMIIGGLRPEGASK